MSSKLKPCGTCDAFLPGAGQCRRRSPIATLAAWATYPLVDAISPGCFEHTDNQPKAIMGRTLLRPPMKLRKAPLR